MAETYTQAICAQKNPPYLRKVWPLPWAPGKSSLDPWNALPEGVFSFAWGLGQQIVKM